MPSWLRKKPSYPPEGSPAFSGGSIKSGGRKRIGTYGKKGKIIYYPGWGPYGFSEEEKKKTLTKKTIKKK